jgi:hypothetical protein
MNAATLPQNAQPILQARLKGMKPADMVIVSMIGPVATENPVVFAKAGVSYDWRWARGLDLCLYLNAEEEWPATLLEIAKARPDYLNLWSATEGWGAHVYLVPTHQDIVKPPFMWKFELDFLPWMDFQNQDFINRRIYGRDERGMPYAARN